MKQLIPFLLLLSLTVGASASFADDDKKAEKSASNSSIGNIAPYRRDMLMRIAKDWKPIKNESLTVIIKISKEGKLLNSSLEKSSGSKEMDQRALDSLQATKFAPLPDWYHEKSIDFKIDLEKVDKR